MSRVEFMKQLESLLSDIPLEERQEALQYYNDYFEDAGEGNEDEVIKEFGSPERIAGIIKADLNSNSVDRDSRGYYTEKGYKDSLYQENKYEIIKTSVNTSEKEETKSNQKYSDKAEQEKKSRYATNTNIGLLILLGILFIPVIFPLAISILSVVFAFVVTIVGLFIGFGVAGLAMIGAGVALFIAGLIQIGIPLAGLLLCGAGLLVFGLGMMFTLFSALLCKKVIPTIFKGIIELCRLPFKNRRVMA